MSDILMVSASLIDKSCDIDLYHRGPTVKQMANLMEIFGGEPSWHQDGLLKEEELVGILCFYDAYVISGALSYSCSSYPTYFEDS